MPLQPLPEPEFIENQLSQIHEEVVETSPEPEYQPEANWVGKFEDDC